MIQHYTVIVEKIFDGRLKKAREQHFSSFQTFEFPVKRDHLL